MPGAIDPNHLTSSARAPLRRARVAALSALARRRAVILGYHGVSDWRPREDLSRLQVSPARFAAQLEGLREAGFRFVTVAELARRLGPDGPPAGLAAVSFDDGMRNNLTVARPILDRLGIPATVYVTIDFLGARSPWIGPGGDGEMLTEDEVRALAANGWEIGAHTVSHPDLATLTYEECHSEIDRSRRALQEITGAPVATFAYPFGRYGPAAVAAARDCGLAAAVTIGSGSWEPFELTRAMVSAGDPDPVVLLKMLDAYEPLLASRPAQAARRLSRTARDRLRGS